MENMQSFLCFVLSSFVGGWKFVFGVIESESNATMYRLAMEPKSIMWHFVFEEILFI